MVCFLSGKLSRTRRNGRAEMTPFRFILGWERILASGKELLLFPFRPFLFSRFTCFFAFCFFFLLNPKSGCGISLVFFEKFTCVSEIPQ